MRAKATSSLVLTLALLFTALQAYAASPPKPGGACAKVSSTQIYKDKMYSCIKSGKKLVWNKGVVVAKKQPTSTSTPTPIQTPTTNGSSTMESEGDFGEFIAQEVGAQFKLQTLKNTLLDVYYSPTTDQESSIVKKNVDDAFKSLSYWTSLGVDFNQRIALVFVTEKDQNWWKDFKNRLGSSEHELDRTTFAKYMTQPFMGYAGIGAKINNLNAPFHVLLFLSSNLESKRDKYWAETMSPHEFVHIVQLMMIEESGNFNSMDRYACWFIEGLARFYERAVQYDQPYEVNLTYKEMKIRQLAYFDYIIPLETSYGSVKSWTEDTYLRFLVDNQYRDKSDVCKKTGYGYSIGWPITEKFYSDFGPRAFVRIMQEVKITSGWDKAFKNATGQEHKSWLKEAAIPYLLKQK